MPKSADDLSTAISEFMKDRGVHDFFCVAADPDSTICVTSMDGNIPWMAGILTLELEDLKAYWRDESRIDG